MMGVNHNHHFQLLSRDLCIFCTGVCTIILTICSIKRAINKKEWELGSAKRKKKAILKWKARLECPHPRWHGNGKW